MYVTFVIFFTAPLAFQAQPLGAPIQSLSESQSPWQTEQGPLATGDADGVQPSAPRFAMATGEAWALTGA
jgi:hypothetical protein